MYKTSTTPDLCTTFRQHSESIWKEIKQAQQYRVLIDEETVTNNLILAIKKSHPNQVFHYQFNKREEDQNGADWEWWLADGTSWSGFLIQAKILDQKTYKYLSFKHKVGSARIPQIILLINAANSKSIIPLYFFYNYQPGNNKSVAWNCNTYSRQIPKPRLRRKSRIYCEVYI